MSLILIRDLDGKGNCDASGKSVPLSKVTRSDGTSALVATGGTHLKLATGKAEGMVFAPWQIVKCGSTRQEDAILRHCEKMWGVGKAPIVRMNWSDPVMSQTYRERNKGLPVVQDFDVAMAAGDKDATLVAALALIQASSNGPDRAARVIERSGDIDTAPKREFVSAPSPEREKAAKEDDVDTSARHKQYADSVYQTAYDKHRADGKTEAQAATYAERSRDAALRRERPAADETPAQAAG
mgnify:FL=1